MEEERKKVKYGGTKDNFNQLRTCSLYMTFLCHLLSVFEQPMKAVKLIRKNKNH